MLFWLILGNLWCQTGDGGCGDDDGGGGGGGNGGGGGGMCGRVMVVGLVLVLVVVFSWGWWMVGALVLSVLWVYIHCWISVMIQRHVCSQILVCRVLMELSKYQGQVS